MILHYTGIDNEKQSKESKEFIPNSVGEFYESIGRHIFPVDFLDCTHRHRAGQVWF